MRQSRKYRIFTIVSEREKTHAYPIFKLRAIAGKISLPVGFERGSPSLNPPGFFGLSGFVCWGLCE
jgi:hypothetical protein